MLSMARGGGQVALLCELDGLLFSSRGSPFFLLCERVTTHQPAGWRYTTCGWSCIPPRRLQGRYKCKAVRPLNTRGSRNTAAKQKSGVTAGRLMPLFFAGIRSGDWPKKRRSSYSLLAGHRFPPLRAWCHVPASGAIAWLAMYPPYKVAGSVPLQAQTVARNNRSRLVRRGGG